MRGFGEKVRRIIPYTRFFFPSSSFLPNNWWKSAGAYQFYSLCQKSVHSGSMSWDDCGRAFPDELCASSFPCWVPTLCLDSSVSQLPLRWVKNVCRFICYLPPAVWHDDWSRLRATTVTRGQNGYLCKSQHRKFTLEKNILPPLLPGIEPVTFQPATGPALSQQSYIPAQPFWELGPTSNCLESRDSCRIWHVRTS